MAILHWKQGLLCDNNQCLEDSNSNRSSRTCKYSVFIKFNEQADMAAGTRRINMCILFSGFTKCKLPSIHSESVPRSGSKTSTYSHAEKKTAI